ncbi:MAG: FGGY family carbohydrate kinase, partial [Bradyrhizobium sp.]|nr:FGGY family carbohydrate kinase [Bradyrhizobium sp.]
MFLGLDVGTSGVKAVLEDEAGALVATASRPLTLSHPKPLWSEQNPDDWVAASVGAVDDLARLHPRETASVSGIGLSGQM